MKMKSFPYGYSYLLSLELCLLSIYASNDNPKSKWITLQLLAFEKKLHNFSLFILVKFLLSSIKFCRQGFLITFF